MSAIGDVSFGPCRACCRRNLIPLIPQRGDVIWTYEHEVIATLAGTVAVLRCAESGDCIYLGPDGCTIHERAPAVCRAFDCRDLFRRKTRDNRDAMLDSSTVSREVFSAGRKRLNTLDLR